MNSQELKCFVVAADRLNFTRAAKELYVTPPTVTHHIQHLEEELGVKPVSYTHLTLPTNSRV